MTVICANANNSHRAYHVTSPDADGLDAELCRVDSTLGRSDDELINVLVIKLLLAVGIKPRVTLITAQTQTCQNTTTTNKSTLHTETEIKRPQSND